MNALWFVLEAYCAGLLAGLLTRGRGFGWIGNLIAGLIGAGMGSVFVWLFGWSRDTSLSAIALATAGASTLVLIFRRLERASAPGPRWSRD